jgi:hypothetical protein
MQAATGETASAASLENPTSPPNGGSIGQPWEAIGMSRSNWYRLGKPDVKPRRETQAQSAHHLAVSVRRLQRAPRVRREAPQLIPFIRLGLVKTGTVEKYLGNEDRLAMLIVDLQERAEHLKPTTAY